MGRALGIKDSFTYIFGDKRGLADSLPLHGGDIFGNPFADSVAIAQRRMALVQWMMLRSRTKHFMVDDVVRSSRIYDTQQQASECSDDFEILVAGGVCRLSERNNSTYLVTAYETWPEDYKKTFREWLQNGSPGPSRF